MCRPVSSKFVSNRKACLPLNDIHFLTRVFGFLVTITICTLLCAYVVY